MNKMIKVHGIANRLADIADLIEYVVISKCESIGEDEQFYHRYEFLMNLLNEEIEKLQKLSEKP